MYYINKSLTQLIMKKIITFLILLVASSVSAQDDMFVHTTTESNTSGNVTYLNHPSLNNNPDAKIVFTHTSSGIENNEITGLWYDGAKWSLFNENFTHEMTVGVKFVVYIADPANVITHIATAANRGSSGNFTIIDDERFNGEDPGPYAVMCNYWNPNGVYNTINYGFLYDVTSERRIIFGEGVDDIPDGAAFNVLINGADNANQIEHQAEEINIFGSYTKIDDPLLNDKPEMIFVFSHYWGSMGDGTSKVTINKVLSSYYDGDNWGIYTEDGSSIPEGATFDIVIAPQSGISVKSSILDLHLEAFPNPTIDFVTLKTTTDITKTTIYNILGKQLAVIKGTGTSVQIDLSSYQSGTYFVKVHSANNVSTLKLIKK